MEQIRDQTFRPSISPSRLSCQSHVSQTSPGWSAPFQGPTQRLSEGREVVFIILAASSGEGTHHIYVHLAQLTRHSHMPSLHPCSQQGNPVENQFQMHLDIVFCKYCFRALARAPAPLHKDALGAVTDSPGTRARFSLHNQQPEGSEIPTFGAPSEQKSLDHTTRQSPFSPATFCRAAQHLCETKVSPALRHGWAQAPCHPLPSLSGGTGSPAPSC